METIFTEARVLFPWLRYPPIKNITSSRARSKTIYKFKKEKLQQQVTDLDELLKNSEIPTDLEKRYKKFLNSDIKATTRTSGKEFFIQLEIDRLKSKIDSVDLEEMKDSENFNLTLKEFSKMTELSPMYEDSDEWSAHATNFEKFMKDLENYFTIQFKFKQSQDKKRNEEKKKKFEAQKAANEKELILTEGELKKKMTDLLKQLKITDRPTKTKPAKIPTKINNQAKSNSKKSGKDQGRKPAQASGRGPARAPAKSARKSRPAAQNTGRNYKKQKHD